MPSPNRRTRLALGLLAGALVLSGCTGGGGGGGDRAGHPDRPDPDLPLRARAVAATDALLADYDAVLAGPGAAQADRLRTFRADLVAHRTALASGLPSPGDSASPGGSTPPSAGASPGGTPPSASSTPPSPGGSPGTRPTGGAVNSVAALAAAERQTAGARLADLDAASPALAKLLAAVSASDALHAAALGDSGPITVPAPAPSAAATPTGPSASGSPAPLPSASTTALQSALAAEHAAVYGYGVVGAWLPVGPQRQDGYASYAVHQAERDEWQRLLGSAGATPTAAAPGYRLPFPVTSAATAGQLAAHIETQLTGVYAGLVAATTGPLRQSAATALRDTALRATHWGADLSALPGLPDQPAAKG
ncbi:ferritin-like domain-containing protein [Kitasatospora sp. HPMI-4]|uniref:ferritin-like domain-containing protein n=1 Tax=Kitasatospora sp. HPMI-4 TaxID=3448443 RepID=UPI003F1CDA55